MSIPTRVTPRPISGTLAGGRRCDLPRVRGGGGRGLASMGFIPSWVLPTLSYGPQVPSDAPEVLTRTFLMLMVRVLIAPAVSLSKTALLLHVQPRLDLQALGRICMCSFNTSLATCTFTLIQAVPALRHALDIVMRYGACSAFGLQDVRGVRSVTGLPRV